MPEIVPRDGTGRLMQAAVRQVCKCLAPAIARLRGGCLPLRHGRLPRRTTRQLDVPWLHGKNGAGGSRGTYWCMARHSSCITTVLGAAVRRLGDISSASVSYRGGHILLLQASSSELCSMASGIFATDIRVRAIWFNNWSAFSSSASDLESRATIALCRSCCARFFAVVYPEIS